MYTSPLFEAGAVIAWHKMPALGADGKCRSCGQAWPCAERRAARRIITGEIDGAFNALWQGVRE